MGTRSCIAVKLEDGSFRGVYCHWDGYPSWNGRILHDSYNSKELALAVVDLGNLSQLRPNLTPDPSRPHTYDDSQDGVTVAYHRDRGSENDEFVQYTGKTVKALADKVDCKYIYVFEDGAWTVREWGYDAGRWSPAKPVTLYRDTTGEWHDEVQRQAK